MVKITWISNLSKIHLSKVIEYSISYFKGYVIVFTFKKKYFISILFMKNLFKKNHS